MNNIQNLLTGEAGVLRVASEFMMRGMNVAKPFVDGGADLIVDGRARIQVKTSHIAPLRGKYMNAYWFKLWQSPIVTGHSNIRRRGTKTYDGIVDFVVFFGVEEGRFWIVPTAELRGAACVVLGPQTHFRNRTRLQAAVRACEGRWDLVEAFIQPPAEVENSIMAPVATEVVENAI